jgi:hypothetical protein
MQAFTRLCDVAPMNPAAIRVRLANRDRTHISSPIAVSPVEFLTDFSTFLTALRAAGGTWPVQVEALHQSWEEFRDVVRRQLLRDPWGEKISDNYRSMYGLDLEVPAEQVSERG